jgi:hypothetical protein
VTVIATNALGDALNDFMNPRTRRARMPTARVSLPLAQQAPKLNQARTS